MPPDADIYSLLNDYRPLVITKILSILMSNRAEETAREDSNYHILINKDERDLDLEKIIIEFFR